MNRKGFTLVELLVTILIIGLVVGLSVFGIINLIKDSENKTVVISKNNIMEAARIYSSEADSSLWKKNDDYDAFCVTVGELMNKGFIDEKGIISNKDIKKDTYVIVKRDNITYSNISEEIVSDEAGTEDNETCTGQSSNGEGYTAPVIANTINYTNLLKIPFSTGRADSGIKNYKCLYGESSSSVNKEGNIEGNTCIISNLKNNKDYYILIYMNTIGGSSILAAGDRNYKTSDFSETTFQQNKNVVTIKYNNKDINEKEINNPSYYFTSDIEGVSNVKLKECNLKKNVFTCSGETQRVAKGKWYKSYEPQVDITYPEENNIVNINARVYDGSNNYKNDSKEFTINKYTVKFYRNNVLNIDGNTGNYIERYCIAGKDETCSITSASITPQIGYSVVGWNTSASATSSSWNIGVSKEINSNLEYYAISRINIVTIQYSANGGDKIKSPAGDHDWTLDNEKYNGLILQENNRSNFFTIKHGDSTSEYGLSDWNNPDFINVEKKGYHAVSDKEWICVSSNCAADTYSHSAKYAASDFCDSSYGDCTVVLGVNWTPNTFYIKFNGNGSTSGSMSDQKFTYDVSQNLTANKFEKYYTVTYNYNGNGSSNITKNVNAIFNGWAASVTGERKYIDKQNVSNLTTTNGNIVNLYAKWTDGSITLPTPTCAGYTFNGWYTSASGGTKVGVGGSSYIPTASITLYAQWTTNSYELRIDPNGGYRVSDNNTGVISVTKDYGAEEIISERSRFGYTLTGYIVKNTATGSTAIADLGGAEFTFDSSTKKVLFIQGSVPITLVAQWRPNTYKVTLDNQGATTVGTSAYWYQYNTTKKVNGETVYYWTDQGLSNPMKNYKIDIPMKKGYTFDGYYTGKNGTGTQYVDKDGICINNIYSSVASNTTLYANWKPNKIKITFDAKGGTGGTRYIWYYYGISKFYSDEACTKEIKSIVRPTRTGYTYVSYYGDGSSGGNSGERYVAYENTEFADDLATDIYKDAILYANWDKDIYTITYNKYNNLLSGLGDGDGSSHGMYYSVKDGIITVTAKQDDGYGYTDGRVTLEAGKTYVFSTYTNGIWPSHVEAFLMRVVNENGDYDYHIRMESNNYTFTPAHSGTYWLRLDVNNKGQTYMFSDVRISELGSMNLTYGSTYTNLPNPTRMGLIFDGWYYNGTKVSNGTAATLANGNHRLEDRWIPETYTNTITHIVYGGNPSVEESFITTKFTQAFLSTITFDSSLVTTAPEGTGFTHWGTGEIDVSWGTGERLDSNSSWVTYYSNDTSVQPNRNITINAYYRADVYNITYNMNEGTNNSSNPSTYTVKDEITLKNPTRNGYTFGGWYTNSNFSGTAVTQIVKGSTGNKTFYAKWIPNTNTAYKVEHWQQNIDAGDTQNNTNYSLVKTENLTGTTGASITPSVQTYTGFTAPSTKTTTVLADGSTVIRYYYTRNSYTVILNKGTGISSVIGAGTYDYGKSVTINVTVSSGYAWKNWTGSSTVTTQSYTFTISNSNVSYTANANVINYTILYNLNGGTNPTSEVVSSYNVTASTFNLPTPSKIGYTFEGWYTSSNLSGTAVTQIVKGSTGNKEFYAKWTESNNTAYKVEHWQQNIDAGDTQNNTNYTLKDTENLTGTTGASITPSVKAYTGFTAPSTKTTTVLADGSTVIRYYYTRNSYTVILNKGTGISSVIGAGTYDFGKTVTINAIVSNGYTWKNWTGTSTVTEQSYIFTMPSSDVSYNANANVINYTITSGKSIDVDGNPKTYTINDEITIKNPTLKGYTFIGWTGSNGSTPQTTVTIPKGTTGDKTYIANWRQNIVTILYSVNGGTIKDSTTADDGTINNWKTGINGIIYRNDNGNYNANFFTINHGDSTSNDGLVNWDNGKYIKISKTGYHAPEGNEWKCLSGCTSTYSDSKVYSASDFCDSSNGDCTVVLGVNWSIDYYEFKIVYQADTGTILGGYTEYIAYGDKETINPPYIDGYYTPLSEVVYWNRPEKTITFTYNTNYCASYKDYPNYVVKNGVKYCCPIGVTDPNNIPSGKKCATWMF